MKVLHFFLLNCCFKSFAS